MVQEERLSYILTNLVTSATLMIGAAMLTRGGIYLLGVPMARAKDLTKCLWSYTWLDDALANCPWLVEELASLEDQAWFEGPALEDLAWGLEMAAAEVDRMYSVDSSISSGVVVWILDGGLGGKLPVCEYLEG